MGTVNNPREAPFLDWPLKYPDASLSYLRFPAGLEPLAGSLHQLVDLETRWQTHAPTMGQ